MQNTSVNLSLVKPSELEELHAFYGTKSIEELRQALARVLEPYSS